MSKPRKDIQKNNMNMITSNSKESE